jgi:hypothetical protein
VNRKGREVKKKRKKVKMKREKVVEKEREKLVEKRGRGRRRVAEGRQEAEGISFPAEPPPSSQPVRRGGEPRERPQPSPGSTSAAGP